MEIKIGSILCSRWGYNCTRWSFYKVIGLTDKSVKLVKIGKVYTEGAPNYPCASVMPVDNGKYDKPFTRRIKTFRDGEQYVSISKYEFCHRVHELGREYDETCD